MGISRIFHKKEKNKKEEIITEKKETDLQIFFKKYQNFSNDNEREIAYAEFAELLLLNPELVNSSAEDIAKKAESYANDLISLQSAECDYRFAAGIALLEGNANALKEYITRLNEIRAKRGKEKMFDWILENPEKAVRIAKDFYEWRKIKQ